MNTVCSRLLNLWFAWFFVFSLTAGMAHASNPGVPFLRTGLVQVDVYDRVSGAALPVFQKDGRYYIVGNPGHEYAVRIRNCTAARILVVTSVDGVNVVSGETATPSQSGYVLDPWGSVEIKGWRKNLQRTAAFFFTEHQNSYAARTGRPDNVGVIGVAVFREKVQAVTLREREQRLGNASAENAPQAPAAEGRLESHADASPQAGAARESDTRDELAREDSRQSTTKQLGKLGTGHGRNEHSRATVVRFERASESPAETVALQYDRRENLIALGVLPRPSVARRNPDPFPGEMRFAPDPR